MTIEPATEDSAPSDAPTTLASLAREDVRDPDLDRKVDLAHAGAKAWFDGRLPLGALSTALPMPGPSRPAAAPELLMPRHMPRRSTGGEKGRFALLHALCHIELNAVDMTWDLLGRFAHVPMPRPFYDNFVQVGLEEAKHFRLLTTRLAELGGGYGDQPAHDGLWQAAEATRVTT